MSRTIKRFLSILLAAAMILSLGISGWAIDGDMVMVDQLDELDELELRPDLELPDHVVSGTDLELEEIDPSTLNVPKLGEIEKDDEIVLNMEDLVDLDEVVRVSIVLDRPSTLSAGYSTENIAANRAAMSYRQTLRQQQANVESAIASAGVSMNVKWNLTLAVNIISAEVRFGDIETIKQVPGVSDVWLETRYEPQVDEVNTAITTEYMVGAAASWKNGYTGAGSRVAIIDTGTDQDHQSFSAEALEYALKKDGLTPDLLTWEDISAVASELNVKVTEDVYKNTKIPYAYNYVDRNYTTDHLSDTQEEHGSHVSGIAAANRYVKVGDEFVDAAENFFAVGVAPDAQILTMKVFGAGGGAYDSDYMSAIDDAIILNADSVNLSLGSSSPGFTFSNGYQDIMESLVDSGTVVVMSAGNSYSWADNIPNDYPYLYLEDISLHTGGSPGSFTNSLGVASANNVGSVAEPLIFNSDLKVSFNESATYGNAPIRTIAGTYDYILIDGPGVDDDDHVGQEGDAFFALGADVVKGKIALCYRGSSSFFAKANAAAAMGAAAVVIINNTSGVIGLNLTGYNYTAPVVSFLQADGNAVKAASEKVTDANGNVLYYTGKVEVTDKAQAIISSAREDADVSVFSSWGVPGSLIMKPEITAPGGNIYSVFGSNLHEDGSVAGGSDQYEYMSGTSMAAPHITGMAALLGQYIRDNDLEEATSQSARTLINSLLMSTATPMHDSYGDYLPILQQGAGLGDTFAAMQAKSYILMDEKATSGAADGKVKVELGQDAGREGVYSFSFTVNNFSDVEMAYELSADMFTQGLILAEVYAEYGYDFGSDRMDTATMNLAAFGDYSVSFAFDHLTPNPHDVNKDGATNKDDAQAILDYLTGKVDGETLNLAAGEMDGVEGLSSYDAQLLLTWETEAGADDLVVPAGKSVTVTATITFSDDLKDTLNDYFVNGAWVEGFAYVTPVTTSFDGEILGAEHSIPILGFYGRFTDASMFDCVDAITSAYGTPKVSYTGHPQTNYLTVNYGKSDSIFMGNPYIVEDEIHYSRFSLNSDTQLVNFRYNLIRNAASTGWIALDDSYDVLKSGTMSGNTVGAYYHANNGKWMETATKTAKVGTTAGKLGLKEGDSFFIGEFAIPEYYFMQLHPGVNASRAVLTDSEIAQLLADKELGEGSRIGYNFLIDDTAPTITKATLSEDKSSITITAKDDNYIAVVAIVDLTGKILVGEAPEQSAAGEEVTVTLDATGLDGAVAAFVGDYAANEDASLIRISGEGPVEITEENTIYFYRPATSLVVDGDYVIVSEDSVGRVKAMANVGGSTYYVVPANVTIEEGTIGSYTGKYIDGETVAETMRWYASPFRTYGTVLGCTLRSVADDLYLYGIEDSRPIVYAGRDDPWKYQNNMLTCAGIWQGANFYLTWDGSAFFCSSTEPSTHLYIYVRDSYTETNTIVIDPDKASSVTVNPDQLVMMVGDTAEVKATVEPLVLPDKSVKWSSGDESIATVDENGIVTAVAGGETVITASSVTTPEVVGTVSVKVLSPEPVDAVVYGQVATADDNVQFVGINLNDMSLSQDYADGNILSYFYGGGVAGGYMYGNDVDNDFHRYVWSDETGFTYDGAYHWEISDALAVWDATALPSFTIVDYAAVDTTDEDDTNDEPVKDAFPFLYASLAKDSVLELWLGQKSSVPVDLSSLKNFVAISFAGYFVDSDSMPNLLYYLLADDGSIYLLDLYAYYDEDNNYYDLDLTFYGDRTTGVFAQATDLLFGENKMAYSMSYYYNRNTGAEGLIVADSDIGGIYYIDISGITSSNFGSEIEAQFAGCVDNAISLTTLSNMSYDMISDLGEIEVNAPSGETGNAENGFEISENLAAIIASADVMKVEQVNLSVASLKTEDSSFAPADDDIAIGDEGDDEIIVVGGLDAIRNIQTRRSMDLLKAGELVNPSYEEDGYVEIAITTPDATEEVDKFYNGFATLEYDPAALSFQSLTPNAALEITSYTVDEEAGLIKFAYASVEPVAAGPVANVKFSVPENGTIVTATTLEANDDLDVGEETEIRLGEGFKITIKDSTLAKATVTGIDEKSLYKDEVPFTVSAEKDQAVLVAIKDVAEDGTVNYTVLPCTTDETGAHKFSFTIEKDTVIVLIFRGDTDMNGVVNGKDGAMVSSFSVGKQVVIDPLAMLAVDVDFSGVVNGKDGAMISAYSVSKYKILWQKNS